MDPKVIRMLQERYLLLGLYKPLSDSGRGPCVTPGSVEPNRRKQRRVVDSLVAAGYLTEDSEGLFITSKAADEVGEAGVDLAEIWREQHFRDRRWDRTELPAVRIGRYSPVVPLGVVKSLLLHAADYRWWVAYSWPLDHNQTPRADGIKGPFDLAEARAAHRQLGAAEFEITVGNAELEAYVAAFVVEREMEEAVPKNLPWGLAALGILSEDEAQLVASGGSGGSLVLSGGSWNAGPDPDRWGQKVEEGIDRGIEQLAKLHERLAVLRKLQSSVSAYGGWDKFLIDYRVKLRAAMVEQKRPSPAAAEVA